MAVKLNSNLKLADLPRMTIEEPGQGIKIYTIVNNDSRNREAESRTLKP